MQTRLSITRLAVALTLLSWAGAGRADAQDKPGNGAAVAEDAFLKHLRQRCVSEPELRGAYVGRPAGVDRGRLQLTGFLDREGQGELLEREAMAALERVPAWKKLFPAGVSAKRMEVFPVRSKYLREAQAHLAATERADRQQRDALRRTRLDDVYYDAAGGNLTFVGVCCHPWSTAKADAYYQLVEVTLTDLFVKGFRLPKVDKREVLLDARKIRPWGDPLRALQRRAVEELRLDAVLFRDAWYDAAGTLQLSGMAGSADVVKRIDEHLRKEAVDDLSLNRPGAPGGPGWSLEGMKVVPWRIPLPALQRRLADGDRLFRRTRLDRAAFAYTDAGGLELRFEGVCCDPALADPAKGDAALKLHDFLEKACHDAWPALQFDLKPSVNVRDIRHVPQPGADLQNQVASDPALDGVNLEDDAFFDRDGRLALAGVWQGSQQAPAVRALIARLLKGPQAKLLRDPEALSLEYLRVFPSGEVLAQLRAWAADERDLHEVWLERLYFDAEGKLSLRAHGPRPEDQAKLSKRTAELLASPAWRAAAAGIKTEVRFYPRESVTRHLREKVVRVADPHWDGVMIERGFYDADGTFSLVGLVDRDAQADEIRRALDGLAATASYRAQWVRRPSLARVRVVPVAPMLRALARVMPDDPVFDGIRIDRAYHGAANKLVFTGFVVTQLTGGTPPQRVTVALKRIEEALADHPEWRLRLAAGVALPPPPEAKPPQPADDRPEFKEIDQSDELAEAGVARAVGLLTPYMSFGPEASAPAAACAVAPAPRPAAVGANTGALPPAVVVQAREALDTAILHRPDNSAAWFLRGLLYLAEGDRELAARDVRRMVLLDHADPYSRERRLEVLEPLQGQLRAAAGVFADRVSLQVGFGRRRMSLVVRR